MLVTVPASTVTDCTYDRAVVGLTAACAVTAPMPRHRQCSHSCLRVQSLSHTLRSAPPLTVPLLVPTAYLLRPALPRPASVESTATGKGETVPFTLIKTMNHWHVHPILGAGMAGG
jgi:hypothetical protein